VILSKKSKIKQVLMDQGVISGIGNIYANEILWKAKINPLKSTSSLSDKELKNIFNAMNLILKKSIKLRGVSIQDYRDVFGKLGEYQNHRLVYGKSGEKCKRCNAKIERIKISQRSTHFCPKCQTI
jgi:formamidopyrimidine-DNA glycosylase